MKAKLRLLALPLVVCAAAIATIAASSGASAAGTCPAASTSSSSSSSKTAAVSCPVVTTAQPSAVTDSAATLHGTVNPEGTPATCSFEYGPTTSYGSRTNDTIITGGTTPQQVTATLTGLHPSTTFHVALVCSNTAGTATGQDVAFSTSNGGASVIRLSGHTGFVSQSAIAGVFIGCYGARPCIGSLTLTRLSNGAVVGHRSTYYIAPNSGGIVHVPLSSGAMSALRSQGFLFVNVSSTTTDGQTLQGGDSGRTLQLHIFR